MLTRFFCTALALASYVAAVPMELEARATPCVKGVFIIAAHGTNKTSPNFLETNPAFAKIGKMGDIADAVIKKVGQGSFLQAVPYPMAPEPFYSQSMHKGVDAVQSMIMDYVNKCKSTVSPRIMVLGYSQGAQVMTTALIGGKIGLTTISNLDAFQQFIIGGALFASPSFTAGFEPLDAGNATTSGTAARNAADETSFNNKYGMKVRDFCQEGDKFCASGTGPDNLDIHHAEVGTYQQAATTFLLGLV